MWWPALGGAVVGVGGLIEPHALGVGYDNIAALLQGKLAAPAAAWPHAGQGVIWSVALGSGTSGGVLAPLLIMGGALGAISGDVVLGRDAGLWALVGMAAMMGGTMRSPLTAIVFALETTGNMGALLPTAIACTMAHATTVLLLRRSILTEKLARRGHHVAREYAVDPFESIRAAEIMARPVDSLSGAATLGEVAACFAAPDAPRHKCYPVVEEGGRVIGLFAPAELPRLAAAPGHTVLRDVIDRDAMVCGYEDELAGHIADRMAETGVSRMPILRRVDDALVGMVGRSDLLKVRASTVRHEREREVLIRIGGAQKA